MVLTPTSNRMAGVDHCVVPLAIPEPVVEPLQATEATPTLSEAVPLMTMLDWAVYSVVAEGEVICKDGGVVSGVKVTGGAV